MLFVVYNYNFITKIYFNSTCFLLLCYTLFFFTVHLLLAHPVQYLDVVYLFMPYSNQKKQHVYKNRAIVKK